MNIGIHLSKHDARHFSFKFINFGHDLWLLDFCNAVYPDLLFAYLGVHGCVASKGINTRIAAWDEI